MSFGQQIITETSLWLILFLLILLLNYSLFKSLLSRTITLLIATACITVGVSTIIEKLDFNSFIDQQHLSVLEKISNIRSRLEVQIQSDLEISKALVIYIKSNDFSITKEKFNSISQSILDIVPRIRHIAVAENLVINYVYPYEINKKAIGLDYQTNAEQWPTIERAIINNKTILAGPVNLVQGGIAFVGRLPVYRTNEATQNIENLWGLVSVIIDKEELFSAARLYNKNGLNIAIRGADALGENGAVIFGESDLFTQAPTLQNIDLPEGSWQIAAIPTTGWPTSSPAQLSIRLTVLSFYLLAAFFIIFRARQHLRQQRIHQELLNEMEQRKSSEGRYRQLFEHSNDGLFLITDNLISDCNQQLENMLGLSTNSILNHSWTEISSAPQNNGLSAVDYYNQLTNASFDPTLTNETPIAEWTHITAENKTVIMEIFFTPIHTMKSPTLLATCKDVSIRKSMEDEQKDLTNKLFHAEKLKAIGQLAGGIAHDFNNMLSAISGYAQLAKAIVQQENSQAKLTFYLDEAIKAGNRAKILVQQLLAFSRGKNIQPQAITPSEIIKETITMLESTIPTSLKLITNYSDTQSKIESDPTQFQQVVLNLIVNSRDAITDQMGEIHISLEKTSLLNQSCSSCNEKISGEFLQLTVADSGIGISKVDLEHVFEPFYSTKDKSTGAGMGLSVVHGIAHAANGHIILESKTGVGTKIKLIFPILPYSDLIEHTPPKKDEALIKSVQGHILIVDDEKAITKLFQSLLSTMEIDSSVFNDPRKALEYFQGHEKEITLVITDQTMPYMKGTELVHNIRLLNSKTPIILCSGHTDIADEQNLEALGINLFLNKPVDLHVLSDAVYTFHN